MEELATAPPLRRPHRERRHRRKASDAAAAALAASSYGDVFGGPPRFAPPPAFAEGAETAPADYSEVFGGVAASCSIPYLDLPPAVADGGSAGAGGYGEIFGRFDFGDFAVPYEEMLPGAECLAEEIASPSGSSRSSIRKESGQLDAEPSILYQQYPDTGCDQQFDEEQFYPESFPPHGEQRFSMSYNKATRGRADDVVEMTTCIVEPSISYVVASCNLSNDSEMDNVPVTDSGTHANGVKEEMSPQNVAAVSLKSANGASVVDQQQHIPTCPLISENICEDESFSKRSSTHSVSSEEAPSPDYPFLRVSDISLPAAPIKVQPPPMPPSKLLNKNGNKEHGDADVNPNSAAAAAMKEAMEFAEARLKAAKDLMERKGGSFKLRKRPAHHRSTKSTEIKEFKAPEELHLFEEKLNIRLAKEENQNNDIALLDTNGGDGALKPAHCDRDKKGIISPGKPQEMMQNGNELEQLGKWTSDAEFFELVSNDQRCRPNETACQGNDDLMTNSFTKPDQSEKEMAEGFAGEPRRFRKLWDSNNTTVLRMEHVNQGKDGIASMEAEQKAPRLPEVPFCDEKVTYQEPTKGDNCLMTNSSAKLNHSDKEKAGGFAVEPKRSRRLWSNTTTGLRTELVNQGKDGIPSMEAEQKDARLPEVPFCDARVTYQEPSKGDNGLMTNSSAKLDQSDKEMAECFAGEPKRSRKLWGSNNTTGMMIVNQGKDGIACVEAEQKAPRSPEVPFCDERVTYQEPTDSHLKQCSGVGNSEGHGNDGQFEISCMNSLPAEVHADLEMSHSFLKPCLSGGHANGNKNHSDCTAQETPLVGSSNQGDSNKEGLDSPCTDELPRTSARSQVLQELPNVPNTDEIKEGLVRISKLEESAKPHEIFEKEIIFNFADEACLQNENERANEVTSESLIHEEMMKYGIEEKADAHEYFQEADVDQVAGSPEEEGYVTSGSAIANDSEYEEAEVNVFVGEGKLMEPNVGTCGTRDEDQYQFQESQGSWGPQDLESRMDRVEDIISHGGEKEAQKSLLENAGKILVEEVLNHDGEEGQKSMETGDKRVNGVYEEVNVRSDTDDDQFDSVNEFIADDGTDYGMKMGTLPNNLQASSSEACTSMKHLSQNTEFVSVEKAGVLKNLEVDCRGADREIPTKNFTTLEEGQNTGSKMEGDKVAEDTASETVLKSREENLDVQRTKGRNEVKETGEIEDVPIRLAEEKEKECKMEKEKEQDEERWRRELEEEKEREMERAKDRLAVQRATREAHERAFAEVRAKAERIALERITSARQRASAEAHEKEEKTTTQAALEKVSREARMKAERAAVVRATAEARERAIEKAKAAADAKERMEKFRAPFKDSCKAPNQDGQHEAQIQKMASNNHGKSTDIEVVEVESALRHKAKLERHQRTAERAAKALAEKNMRDMLAQREQAEKHRLAEFLDPEVKRWSNGKEGNLRALLSTLQYILGSDSGWQSVPLTDLITAAGVKKAYRKATLCVHPDKVQQRGATIRQKYICEKVFDLLKVRSLFIYTFKGSRLFTTDYVSHI
ncbi:Auxilin-like protein 1 [Dichanthelium oligosanthes]|uniref:Auxilin-like protein 1 n=1 Tax=Dichanthelium oligosanthes TaxID=888268 RepID=A0A1E5UUL0_9POAL|nr:Auxilin-like protein 1 [Dichanthelium oligosanthes]